MAGPATSALDALIRARAVAVIGASNTPNAAGGDKLGTVALKHLIKHGYQGAIYPVNPKETTVEGLPCFPTLDAVPGDIDMAVIAVPGPACAAVMAACGERGVKAAIVLASGFAEAGQRDMETELINAARTGGVRFCGPNTNGLISVAGAMAPCTSMVCQLDVFRPGGIAFITQSGAVGGSMLGTGTEEMGGFSHWISVGNEANLTVADYLDWLADDPDTTVITLFIEGIRDPDRFAKASARAAAAGKPIVLNKIGLSDVSAAASLSHTGAMVGSDDVFNAVCKKFGLVRVDDASELLPTAITFSRLLNKLPRGRNMGLVAPSGGIGGVCADECHRWGLDVPELSAETQKALKSSLPAFAALRNPVDVTQEIRSFKTGYQDTIRTVLQAPEIDGLFLLVTMVAEPRASIYADMFTDAAKSADKPVIVAWTGAASLASKALPALKQNGVPVYMSARGAVKAMRRLYDYGRFLDSVGTEPQR
ncbi:MAG: CoA-binding protein [Rhodospirillaceae bacterium]